MVQYSKTIVRLFCCLQIFYIFCAEEKVLININRIVRELDDSTPCNISEWAGQLSNACKCCLFKWVPRIGSGPGQKPVDQIVRDCIQEGYCIPELIEDFKTSVPSAPDITTALYQLYNTSVVIKIIIDKEGIAIDAQGNLTEQGAKTLLEKAYQEGKLPNKDFKSVTCIKMKDIFAEKKGFQTSQLFLITSNCPEKFSYILKGSGYNEAKNLAKFFGLKELDDLIWPNHIKGYPSLAIPFVFFQYNNHYLSLAPTANGRELDSFIIDYFLNPTQENKQKVEQAHFDIGYVLAKFHQRFIKDKNDIFGLTVIHGDLHPRNIFYDITTRQVIFIDNENIPISFEKPKSPLYDIAQFIFFPVNPFMVPKEIADKTTASAWIELIMIPFLEGYISGYPKKNWTVLFNKLVEGIRNFKGGRGSGRLYSKFADMMSKKFEIIKQFVQNNQEKPEQEKLKISLVKLKNSLLDLALSIRF